MPAARAAELPAGDTRSQSSHTSSLRGETRSVSSLNAFTFIYEHTQFKDCAEEFIQPVCIMKQDMNCFQWPQPAAAVSANMWGVLLGCTPRPCTPAPTDPMCVPHILLSGRTWSCAPDHRLLGMGPQPSNGASPQPVPPRTVRMARPCPDSPFSKLPPWPGVSGVLHSL